MKLTEKAKLAINNHQGRVALMSALGFRELWVIKSIENNKPNGPLTTVAAVKAIQQVTGLSQDEILEEVAEVATK